MRPFHRVAYINRQASLESGLKLALKLHGQMGI